LAEAMSTRTSWQAQVAAIIGEVDLLALPTLIGPPPLLSDVAGLPLTHLTAPFSPAGVPAIAMPVPSPGFPVPEACNLSARRTAKACSAHPDSRSKRH
jgi:amidase